MSITSTLCCSLAWRNYPHPLPKITSYAPVYLPTKQSRQSHFLKPQNLGLRIANRGLKLGFCLKAENGDVKGSKMEEDEKEFEELRGNSTMPDRFRITTQETSSPLRWPYFVALGFLIYAWRSVLWELSNWRKAAMGIFQFVGDLCKLFLALIFCFIGDPISYTILYIEKSLYAIRSFYSTIVSSTPITEFTIIIMLASAVLAIGETASPNSIHHQQYLLTAAGIIGYGAVNGVISEPVFWLMLFGLFAFARFINKRDYVSSALPAATLLASVGEPWVRLLSIVSFTALAIHHYSKNASRETEKVEGTTSSRKVPFPLLAIGLAIGMRLAAKWAGYRHLTWMIV